jgi:glycolate oxidase FAD binding subunit
MNDRRSAASAEPAAFAIGTRVPQRIASPTTIGALARVLREADVAGDRVALFGGGTLCGIGRPPRAYELAVSTVRLNKALEYEPRDLTISVEAGMTVDALNRRLARNGQFVPLDAPLPARSTIGGVLAAGWHGPRSGRYGRPRDLVIGATVVLADGTVAASGGRTVKNVSGYDVAKLFIGSLGTLGAIARVNFKTLPRPQLERAALCRLPERTRERAFDALAGLRGEPSAALHVWGFDGEIDGRDGIDGRLLLLFEGSNDGVEHATRDMRSSLGAAGVPETALADANAGAMYQRAIDALVSAVDDRSATLRIGGLPGTVSERLAAAHTLAARLDLRSESIADLINGDVTVRISGESATAFAVGIRPYHDALHDACGAVRLQRAPAVLRDDLEAWNTRPASLDRMRDLKQRFDPKGTLAPGRLFDGI